MSKRAVFACCLLAATAALSGVPNQLLFVGTFPGWIGYGAVCVAALTLAAGVAPAVASPVALLAGATMLSPLALPYSFGLLLFCAGFAVASASKRGPDAAKTGKIAAGIAALWTFYAIGCWLVTMVVPASQKAMRVNELAGETWEFPIVLPRMVVPLGHANHTSGMGVLLLPVFAGLAVAAKGRRRVAWSVAAAAAFVLVIAGGSRAAFLAPATAAGLWLASLPASRFSFRRKLGAFGFGAVVLTGAVFAHPHFRHWILDAKIKSASDLVRKDYVEACVAVVRDRPLTGIGVGAIPEKIGGHLPAHAEQFSAYHAHSTPFQWGAECGVAGLALAALMVLFALLAVAGDARKSGASAPVATGVAMSAAAYAVFGLFDYQANIPANGAVWGVVLGAALPAAVFSGEKYRRPARIVSRVIFAGAALAAAWIVATGIPFRSALRDAAAATDSKVKLNALARAAECEPESPAVRGLVAAQLEKLAGETGDVRFGELADREWETAGKLAPEIPLFGVRRALARMEKEPAAAIPLHKTALRKWPKSSFAWTGLGLAYLKTGDIGAAERTFALGMFVRPESFASPFLRKLPGVSTARILVRFGALRADYEKTFPEDGFAIRALARADARLSAWEVAGAVPAVYLKNNGADGASPELISAISAGGDRARRALIAATYRTQDVEITPEQAALLEKQFRGEAAGFSGVRTVGTPEDTLWFGAYLGVAEPRMTSPYYVYDDLLAVFIFGGSTPVRADANFLRRELAKLP